MMFDEIDNSGIDEEIVNETPQNVLHMKRRSRKRRSKRTKRRSKSRRRRSSQRKRKVRRPRKKSKKGRKGRRGGGGGGGGGGRKTASEILGRGERTDAPRKNFEEDQQDDENEKSGQKTTPEKSQNETRNQWQKEFAEKRKKEEDERRANVEKMEKLFKEAREEKLRKEKEERERSNQQKESTQKTETDFIPVIPPIVDTQQLPEKRVTTKELESVFIPIPPISQKRSQKEQTKSKDKSVTKKLQKSTTAPLTDEEFDQFENLNFFEKFKEIDKSQPFQVLLFCLLTMDSPVWREKLLIESNSLPKFAGELRKQTRQETWEFDVLFSILFSTTKRLGRFSDIFAIYDQLGENFEPTNSVFDHLRVELYTGDLTDPNKRIFKKQNFDGYELGPPSVSAKSFLLSPIKLDYRFKSGKRLFELYGKDPAFPSVMKRWAFGYEELRKHNLSELPDIWTEDKKWQPISGVDNFFTVYNYTHLPNRLVLTLDPSWINEYTRLDDKGQTINMFKIGNIDKIIEFEDRISSTKFKLEACILWNGKSTDRWMNLSHYQILYRPVKSLSWVLSPPENSNDYQKIDNESELKNIFADMHENKSGEFGMRVPIMWFYSKI